MLKLVIASLLVASVFALPYSYQKSATVPLLDGRIIGGSPINIPYHASLQYFGSLICSGSIISPFYVVTVARCTDGLTAPQLMIRAGSDRLSGGVVVAVGTIFQHPSYDDWYIDYDISVLLLAGDGLTLGSAVQPIALPQQSQQIPGGMDAIVSGWGILCSTGTQLQAMIGYTITIQECRAAYGASLITDRMMCAVVPEGNRDAFQGDSGSPLAVNGELIGIFSWSYRCAYPNFPGVYASVPALRSFITQVTGI